MIIVITQPFFVVDEVSRIINLFEQRHIDRLHLRKPNATPAQIEELLQQIPEAYYSRISIHDFHHLAQQYNLGGIHLTSRHPIAPPQWQRMLSTSCHSISELAQRRTESFDYLSLSPIFDSISKHGYHAAFTPDQLMQAQQMGIIDKHVMALGGVTFDKVQQVQQMGFGGAMILGDAWK